MARTKRGRRSGCCRLRDTVIAIWLIGLALFARLPSAPVPLPGLCLTGTVKGHAALAAVVGLTIAIAACGLARPAYRFLRT